MASILRMQGKRGACDPPPGQVAAGVGMDRKPRRTHGFWSIPTPACAGMGTGDCRSRGGLDLADQVQRRLQGLLAFLPLGRADLARVRGDVLRGLDLAQQLQRVAADALGGDLDGLDDALRVDDEGAAVGQAGRAQDLEVARSEEHTSELQSLMRTSSAVLCLKKNMKTFVTL